ncbi:alpha/beta hydrolase [Rhodococcus sp. IEGM 1307]|uniref:alpha/beta fold hydrolase n=1 Tax=Rhodococcus sp. IEGM 1307 TaxID=3047091 RepID=UPI0024B8697B|nr:alpha/beta hydrolase [Rhodococcus sp. IEGM 1307]MDI9979556.1 alpha/beta hydrolase [Rhodococcus sp. IEGM 1307]
MVVDTTVLPSPALYTLPGGARVGARTKGRGRAVLLLHGVGSASASFWAQFETFNHEFELIAWDAFGYGDSSDPAAEPCLDDYAAAAAALLDARGHEDAHVVGVSWGGVVATRLAMRHPKRVRTLALVSSTYGRKNNAAVREGFGSRIAALERDGVRLWAQARVDRQVSRHASLELRRRIVENAVASVRLPGFTAATRTLADTDHRPALDAVQASTIVLCGDQDEITGPAESRVLADGISGAEFLLVPGGGHLLNQDQSGVVNAALNRHWHLFDSHGVELI